MNDIYDEQKQRGGALPAEPVPPAQPTEAQPPTPSEESK